ncbi:unnamed protein product, partial [Dicrocoelium dendriticum]
MKQPLGLCILRPKPEPTDTYSTAASSSSEALDAIPDAQEDDQLDFNARRTSDQSLKAEPNNPVSSLDEVCVIGAKTALPVSEKGQRAHTCTNCGKSFTRADHLRTHLRSVHLKLRDHICKYCGKAFSSRSNLCIHTKAIHLSECDIEYSVRFYSFLVTL